MINPQNLFKKMSIEVTRKCNLKCEHCLRGNPQKVSLDPYIFEDFINKYNLRFFEFLWLNGGEPTLEPNIVLSILEIIKKYDIKVDLFGFPTNGTKPVNFNKIVKFVRSIENIKSSKFVVSNSVFHKESYKKLDLLPLESTQNSVIEQRNNNRLLPLGRAKNKNLNFDCYVDYEFVNLKNLINVIEERPHFLQLSCEGDLVCDLDNSYEDYNNENIFFLKKTDNIKNIDKNKLFRVPYIKRKV